MEAKESGNNSTENWSTPPSPIDVIQKLSEEAVRVAGEALHCPYSGNPILKTPPQLDPAPMHRRARSEVVASCHKRSSSTSGFQKLRGQMKKSLHLGGRSSDEDSEFSSFDPEILANQKRQWYQLKSKTSDHEKYKEPESLFEHFIVVGLRPDANLKAVTDIFVRRKKLEQDFARTEPTKIQRMHYHCLTLPTLEPQVLFKYPPGKKIALRSKDLAAFCFPGGVKARISEKTPSLSDLNNLVYGQEHLSRDDLSFMFSLKVADNATFYGVCFYVQEFVQRPHISSRDLPPLSQSHFSCNRFLISAPRCYCILTRVPFFELHFETLNRIIAQERLNRINQFVVEMSLANNISSPSISDDHINGGENLQLLSDDNAPSSKWEIYSSGSANDRNSSDHSQMRALNNNIENIVPFSDSSSDTEERSNCNRAMHMMHCNGHTPDADRDVHHRTHSPQPSQSFEALFSSSKTVASKVKGEPNDDFKDKMIIEWARETKNDLLQLICGYHTMVLPQRGSQVIFQPLEHLQAVEYERPLISALGLCEKYLDIEMEDSKVANQVKLKLYAAEEAISLSLWTTAALCRVLSLDSFLLLIAGVLLEKQVVMLCPNLGVLSAVVLSIIPIIRPFEWQSLLLPILPGRMLDFLDAPVPFIVGIQNEIVDLKLRTSNLVHVNVAKDQVKSCNLPLLPRRRELICELEPIHSKLSNEKHKAERHPIYKCSEVQAEAAAKFLSVMKRYLESYFSDLRSHTITSVQSNNDRVSILLKDSYINSFPAKDRSFVKLFVETQLFTALSDSRLASYENE